MRDSISEPRRGGLFSGKGRLFDAPSEEALLAHVPAPFFEGAEHWLRSYAQAWRLTARNVRRPGAETGFVSSYIDAAFGGNLFLWDTALLSLVGDIASPLLPGIEALDNFYAKQLEDGEIPREMQENGEDFPYWLNAEGLPLHSYFHNVYGRRPLLGEPRPALEELYFPDLGRISKEIPHYTLDNLNHPLAAWAEWLHYRQGGDIIRLESVFDALHAWYTRLRKLLRHENGLYVTDWASMVNSPRNAHLGCGVDISCEMAMFALHLRKIFDALVHAGLRKPQALFRAELEEDYKRVSEAVNALLWDEESGFYHDLRPDGGRAPVKTVAAFWTLAAELAPPERAARLIGHLGDEKTFGRPHRPPSLAADEPGYAPEGNAWRGAVWPSMQAMLLYGLEKCGEYALARDIARDAVEQTARVLEKTGTLWENYAPENTAAGSEARPDFAGMTAIVPTHFLLRYVLGLRPDAPENTLVWLPDARMLGGMGCGCQNYRFGDIETNIHAWLTPEGGLQWSAQTNRPYILHLECAGHPPVRAIVRTVHSS